MALRDQPYLPLYVQDFLTDEKLIECSAESTGVYIRLMCLMHKSEDYGTILLKQKSKQNPSKIKNFALKLAKQMPYEVDIIERALTELLEENVIGIEGDTLYQKRMVKDAKLSDTRAMAGKSGYKTKHRKNEFCLSKTVSKTAANHQANSENEVVVVTANEYINENIESIGNEDDTTRARDEFPQVMALYMETIGTMPPSKVSAAIQGYLDCMDAAVIEDAIEIAAAENKRSWSYINAILLRRKNEGIRNMADVARENENHRARKEKKKTGNPYLDLDMEDES